MFHFHTSTSNASIKSFGRALFFHLEMAGSVVMDECWAGLPQEVTEEIVIRTGDFGFGKSCVSNSL